MQMMLIMWRKISKLFKNFLCCSFYRWDANISSSFLNHFSVPIQCNY